MDKSANIFLLKLYNNIPNRFKGILRKYITRKEGGQMYSMTLRSIYKKEYNIDIGYGSYGGCFSFKNIPSGVVFGRYCSIAPEIKIYRANHPKEMFTMHPLLYNPVAGYVKEDMLERPSLKIGHDVWIGEWAIILPSVNVIGNGAVIGAGSIVTKDVLPYTVVAGNPAKVICKRFSDDIIQKLENSKWWEMDKEQLIENICELNRIVDL